MALRGAFVYVKESDHFSRLFGLMWTFSVAFHAVFFIAFVIATSGPSKADIKPKSDAIVFDLADLPKGPGIGPIAPKQSQAAALNPFQGRPQTTQDKLTKEDMPENAKPQVRTNSKLRSRETRPEVKVEDKLRNAAIDRLKSMKGPVGGGGEGKTDGGSVAKLYLAKVREKIRSRWNLPSGITEKDMDRSAKVIVRIDTAGNLIGASITASSGNSALDSSIQSAISRATPFTQPPLELVDQVSGGGISFTFKAKEAK